MWNINRSVKLRNEKSENKETQKRRKIYQTKSTSSSRISEATSRPVMHLHLSNNRRKRTKRGHLRGTAYLELHRTDSDNSDCSIIVLTSEENGINMIGMVFYSDNFRRSIVILSKIVYAPLKIWTP